MAEKQEPLAELLIELAKALSRTGYYSADHPEAQKGSQVFVARYHDAIYDAELRLSSIRAGETNDLIVATQDLDDVPIGKIMSAERVALFKRRLLDILERWKLVALSFARSIQDEELLAFLDLASRLPSVRAAEEAKRLDQELLDRGVRGVTLLFRSDLITTQRKLSWQVSLALSRMRKDFTRLPMFQGVRPEAVHDLRQALLHEIFRPLKQPRLLAEILLNLDLAPEMKALGPESIAVVPSRTRLETALLIERERARPTLAAAGPERATEVLAELLATLDDPAVVEEAADLATRVEAAVEESRLASAILERLATRRLADAWLQNLAAVELVANEGTNPDAARVLAEIIRRRLWPQAAALIQRLACETSGAARDLGELVGPKLLQEVSAAFQEAGDAHQRAAQITILCAAGRPGLVAAAELLATVERDLAGLVAALGKREAEQVLLATLGRDDLSPAFAQALLPTAAERPMPALAPALHRLAGHADPHVRRLALGALAPLGNADAENDLANALSDPDGEVRRFAIASLSASRCQRAEVLAAYAATLLDKDDLPLAPRLESIAALARLAQVPIGGGRTAETVLLESLTRAPRGLASHLMSSARAMDELHVATCRALLESGSPEGLALLDALASHARPSVRHAAGAAAAAIRSRGKPSPLFSS